MINWNINVIIPNGLGIMFSIIQISTWSYFYKKNGTKPELQTLVDEKNGKYEA
jgi:hypothetical protein